MNMTNEQIKELLDAFEQDKKIQWMPKHKREWITFFPSDYDLLDLLRDLSEGIQFRVIPDPINIEWITSFEIDKKTQVKHKISYEVDDLGNPIKDTIEIIKVSKKTKQ